jgi:fatty-acyl-CoA synthase
MALSPLVQVARQHSLGDLPRRTARRTPDKLAVIDGATRLTFAELDTVVDRTAAALNASGLAARDCLALLCHNSWQYVVLDFACARAGVVLVPVNFMLGAEEIAYILDHSGAEAFVVEDALLPVAEQALAASKGTATTRAVVRLGGGEAPDGWADLQDWLDHDGTPHPVILEDDDPVRMMFTSGTESRPKGALLSSRSLMWQYVSCAIDGQMSADDVELHTMPLYHCAQLDCFLGVDVYLGATSIILPAPDPGAILRAIEEHGVTKFFAPPTIWIGLLRHPDFDTADLSSLRKGYYGASPMPVAVLEEMRRRLPGVDLWNFYGQTEMAPLATSSDRRSSWPSPARPAGRRSTSRPGSSTTRTSRSRRGRSARSCIAPRTRRSATTATRRRPPRPSAAAGSTPATSATSTTAAASTSWTARRT